ncbi:helix-turn-helix transcriptional regulator [Sphingomonas glacialis]|uniref:LuxR family transcriptional regulator n=1 Tax=Sphingomonas glacialis TaxID=658225 RepID=A0A502FF51_9SPHN|nr:LuxR family transcriptional regulator [Sphingomonas glacialis]TPG48050.1 LuxR family transcriptional regulator [Sphingomonas glacialis]
MELLERIGDFYGEIDRIDTLDRLLAALTSICKGAGIPFLSVTHHVDFSRSQPGALHLHNYPARFAAFHDGNGLGTRDPVHRMSQSRYTGFMWSTQPSLLPRTRADQELFDRAEDAGIGDGYTVPVHMAGEPSGSCSFAVAPGITFPKSFIPLAQGLGIFAFDAARRLIGACGRRQFHCQLTPREREIVLLLGQGYQEKQIARLLRITPVTVNDHLKHARERCGVHKSFLLVVCALASGVINASELNAGHPVSTG